MRSDPAEMFDLDVLRSFLAHQPGMIERVLAVHTRNRQGDCRECTTHSRSIRHPCFLHQAASAAR